MSKDEYIELLSSQEFMYTLTTKMMSDELHSMALAEVLMKKGLFTYNELQDAFHPLIIFLMLSISPDDSILDNSPMASDVLFFLPKRI